MSAWSGATVHARDDATVRLGAAPSALVARTECCMHTRCTRACAATIVWSVIHRAHPTIFSTRPPHTSARCLLRNGLFLRTHAPVLPSGVTGMGQVRDDPEAAQKQEVLLREIADLQDMSAKLSKLQIQVKEMAHAAECSEYAYVTHADLQSLAVFHAKPRTASVASNAAAASVPHTVIAVKAPSGTMLELLHSTNWRNTREEKFEAVLTVKDGAGSIQPFLVQKPPTDPARAAAAAAAKEPPLAPLPAATTSAPLGTIAREGNGTSERLFQVKDLWSDHTKSVRRSLRAVELRAPRRDQLTLRPRRRFRRPTLRAALHYCTTVLLYYCTTVLLYYCTTVLLHRTRTHILSALRTLANARG